ncbi:MAG: hypothetical protein J5X22_09080 [Candidatus Accumulibacter sp.]|uniref:Uncharacterized protein n=1 Tax=Candidatus Accumulibacter cognatus TaxID=2954383 RepID=A0A7D5SVH2_9PROT|nr:hypothetical protein [Accumulibacter sp.]QLH52261.1 MAG: hypothetical protein HWD57_22670 [Candidatus Accumulibacter cognatus]MBN8517411.1 hypothetical protein [Accumulibacter sp.]MBO3710655.1 hypothetical protein [Accumulibacter sp.]MCM8581028.1 hypothetical protein [Accumulibacter sp.]HNO72788.1 hypothetical protein [Accumulibacter sp.]
MHLRKHDLLEMDAAWLKKLLAERLLEVSIRLLDDVKELQDRQIQNLANTSNLPASQASWKKAGADEEENEFDEPHLPFINNATEQALRHWVIA